MRRATWPVLLIILTSCAGRSVEQAENVGPIAELDALFERTSGWTGADGAYSIDLGDRTLWFYGDTWIGKVVDGQHRDAKLVNNSVAVQRGRDVKFYWGPETTAFFRPLRDGTWFWPLHGVLLESGLYVFLAEIEKTDVKSVFGFRGLSVSVAHIRNPRAEPSAWSVSLSKLPWGRWAKGGSQNFGSAVLRDGDDLYVYGVDENWLLGMGGRAMTVARVPVEGILDFKAWRFLTEDGWTTEWEKCRPLFMGQASEFTVSRFDDRYVAVYTQFGLSGRILARFAPEPVGPWGDPVTLYEVPELKWHHTYFSYAGKHHPQLAGEGELVITYAVNSSDFWQMARDARIYRPRFVRVRIR